MGKHRDRVPTCHSYYYVKISHLRQQIPMAKNGCGRKSVKHSSEAQTDAFNRFLMRKNMEIEYPHAIVIVIQRFHIFGKIFPRSKRAWPKSN